MKKTGFIRYLLMVFIAFYLLISLPVTALAASDNRPLLVASIEPLALLAKEFYGEQVTVQTLLLPSQNPHHVAFTPQQLMQLNRADLVLWLGPAAEPYLRSFMANKTDSVTALELPKIAQQVIGGHGHRHGEHSKNEADHDVQIDPHLWTDPLLMSALLPSLVSEGERLGLPLPALQQRAAELQQAFKLMVQQARTQLAPLSQLPWLSYHNPWHYFYRRLGVTAPLTVVPQTGGGVGSRRFVALSQQVSEQKLHCAIVEPEARMALIQSLCRGPDCKITPIDPLGREQAANSYSAWWKRLVTSFKQCLRSE